MLAYAALTLWTGVLYFRAVPHAFVYDDQPQIVRNASIQTFPGTLDYFTRGVDFNPEFTGYGGQFYRPLFYLSLWADSALWGSHPSGFHTTNIVLHALNGILVFLLAAEIFSETAALLCALVWLTVPVHSEVVAWQRSRNRERL